MSITNEQLMEHISSMSVLDLAELVKRDGRKIWCICSSCCSCWCCAAGGELLKRKQTST